MQNAERNHLSAVMRRDTKLLTNVYRCLLQLILINYGLMDLALRDKYLIFGNLTAFCGVFFIHHLLLHRFKIKGWSRFIYAIKYSIL